MHPTTPVQLFTSFFYSFLQFFLTSFFYSFLQFFYSFFYSFLLKFFMFYTVFYKAVEWAGDSGAGDLGGLKTVCGSANQHTLGAPPPPPRAHRPSSSW